MEPRSDSLRLGKLTVSIVIPVFNAARDLRVCLEHCRKLTRQPFEILVADDGSTDSSGAVAQSFGARVIRLPEKMGPARARNLAARQAAGDLLFFVDADVALKADALDLAAKSLENDPKLDAVIGAYDDHPAHPGFLSQYKNLTHCFFHRTGNRKANTFWSGCGMVRRSVFLAFDGYSEQYTRPSVEDIEFGYRLKRDGREIMLDPQVQGTHLKRWTFRGLIKTDIFDRAIPWAELIYRSGSFPDDLNLRWNQRVGTLLVYALATLLAAMVATLLGAPGSLLQLGLIFFAVFCGVLAINRELFGFLARRRGWIFAGRSVPVFCLYQFYSGIAFLIGMSLGAMRPSPAPRPAPEGQARAAESSGD